jgi:hypothetical protein
MQIDQYELLMSNTAVTNAALYGNVLDLRATTRRLGVGARPIGVLLQCTVVMSDSSNNSTLPIYLQTDAAENMASATNAQLLHTFAVNTAVGTSVWVPITASAAERYIQLFGDPQGGDLTTGSFTAFLCPDPQLWNAYPKSYAGPDTA